MRLLDRLLAQGCDTFRTNLPEEMRQWVTSSLEKAQLVVVDNVADYHFQELQRKIVANETQKLDVTDFPNVMLPFESTFLEMRVRNFPILQAGSEECGVLATMSEQTKAGVSMLDSSFERAKETLLQKDARYILTLLFFQYGRFLGKKPQWTATFMFPVSADGQILPVDGGKFPVVRSVYLPPGIPLPPNIKDYDTLRDIVANYTVAAFLHPCFLALSFMHCKNVKVREETPPPKLSKKHVERSGRPLLKYRVLQIDHMKQILERVGKVSVSGLKHALHICRGHFKTYGRDGKGLLFGKHAGTVWIPMITRGSPEHGIVVKDYDVR